MGNQLTGIAPSQIQPVEQYLNDIPDYEFDCNLGSTRFFKVARAKFKEGLTVVKVFVIHDPSLPLSALRSQLEDIALRIQGTTNCLPFQRAVQSDKAALLFRQFIKDSLYDRISTRPFLIKIEKRWLAFQLLCALNQCHKVKVCHGDVKSENIMITGWNWLLLTDFASFKPTYLPEDNPSDFSYFFDTSRRRTCYIAPERFVESGRRNPETEGIGNLDLNDSEVKSGDLSPAMDIFSAGCVITELFTEGTAPFDLSQLLAYRKGEYSPWKVLEKIEDSSIRDLVRHMMQKDPVHRLSAEEYMIQQRGKAFPEYFYTFLKLYIQRFAQAPILPPDDRISSNLTSSYFQFCHTKLLTLQLYLEFSKYVTADVILDRIIPYMTHLTHDPVALVRASFAANIAQLAETALSFLEITQLNGLSENQEQQQQGDQEEEGSYIQDDWHLRSAFFDNIVGVATYVGWQSTSILKPLLEQGLNDPEEFVVHKALGALKCLTELGLIQKAMLQEFLHEVVPFLAHPGVWIRQGAVGFISALANTFNTADIHCKLLPSLQMFLKQSVLQVDKEIYLLNGLQDPIPRLVFDYILRSNTLERLFDVIQKRQYMRNIGRQGHRVVYPELDETMSQAMKEYILKLHRARAGSASRKKKKTPATDTSSVSKNEEWTTMFGSNESSTTSSSPKTKSNINKSSDSLDRKSGISGLSSQGSSSSGSFVTMSQGQISISDSAVKSVTSQIQEKTVINRIQVCHDQTYFATASSDGCVKLWEIERLEGKSVANRSKQTLNKQGGKIRGLVFCDNSDSLAAASDNSTIFVYKIETGKAVYIKTMNIDKEDLGNIVDISYFDTGLISSFAVHHSQCWLSVGTSSGTHVCWDLRFQLPITSIVHPTGARVRRLIAHPQEQSWIISATQGNNEVSMWDVETGARQRVLWASPVTPLSQNQASNHAIYGIHTAVTDTNVFMLTGGSDMRVRFWDVTYPANSYILAGAAADPVQKTGVSYRSRLIDGTEVIQETYQKKQTTNEDIPRRGPEMPPSGHQDIISDVNLCQASQCLVLTGSRDGVVKVWK
ncbi:hypothetical protein KUTeg_002684 [Tegillarca granosa]|uniref:non-specific serine/threonine protein kinase n=1 Tax=Tegillarca granosa TaxID=220873 RepID=A0ABQ9FV04_TEGGR|nr:hypothetical protein KUTeg_002684 [Tegillarca granosa]